MTKYKTITIRLTEAEYNKYKAIKTERNMTWKQMLKEGAYEKKKKPPGEGEAKKNFRKTVHVRISYDHIGRKGRKWFNGDFIFTKVASTMRELELFDAQLEQKGKLLRDCLVAAARNDPKGLGDFIEYIIDNPATSIIIGDETITETNDPEQEKFEVERWDS